LYSVLLYRRPSSIQWILLSSFCVYSLEDKTGLNHCGLYAILLYSSSSLYSYPASAAKTKDLGPRRDKSRWNTKILNRVRAVVMRVHADLVVSSPGGELLKFISSVFRWFHKKSGIQNLFQNCPFYKFGQHFDCNSRWLKLKIKTFVITDVRVNILMVQHTL